MEVKQYDTVILLTPIAGFPKGEKGAVVEIYTTPYVAYDIEIVDDQGKTKGLLEGVRPDQVKPLLSLNGAIRVTSIQIEGNGTRAAVHFSDGKEVLLQANELYAMAK